MNWFHSKILLKSLKNLFVRWLIIGAIAQCQLPLIASTIFSLTGYLGRWNIYFELTSHFKLQYLTISLITFIFFSLTKRKIWWLTSLFCLILNVTVILPWYLPSTTLSEATAKPLRIMLANVKSSNKQYEKLIKLIETEQPDLVAVLEVNNNWVQKLEIIKNIFPHVLEQPRDDNFGIALYSKLPFLKKSVEFLGIEVPSLLGEIEIEGKAISILATHPVPPINPAYFTWRNQQLATISHRVKQLKTPVIVVGDLNTTMWSPFYRDLVENAELNNSRKGFGILPTWPTYIPFLSIPIDHCLVSPGIEVLSSKTGSNIGSDHLPLITDFVLQ